MHFENRIHTLIFGASLRDQRISNQVIYKLNAKKHIVSAIGLRTGIVDGVSIQTGHPKLTNIHTITMYMNESRQKAHIDYLLSLNPQRIIFNPGAENPEFYNLAQARDIDVHNACTLVMLLTGEFEKTNL